MYYILTQLKMPLHFVLTVTNITVRKLILSAVVFDINQTQNTVAFRTNGYKYNR